MFYRILADTVLVVHLIFILFVLFGGLLVIYKRWLVWLHVPAMVWGALISFAGWVCPLTPVENSLRRAAGQEGYSGSFVSHYLLPVIYPEGYSRDFAIFAGMVVVVINASVYGYILYRGQRRT